MHDLLMQAFACMQATKGKQKLSFFTMPEYEAWKKTASAGWTIKYYKGLGTSDKKEAQEYFAAIDQHRKSFVYEGKPSFKDATHEYTSCKSAVTSQDNAQNFSSNVKGAMLAVRCGLSLSFKQLHLVVNNRHRTCICCAWQANRMTIPLSWRSPRRRLRSASSGWQALCPAPTWTRAWRRSPTATLSTRCPVLHNAHRGSARLSNRLACVTKRVYKHAHLLGRQHLQLCSKC